MEDKKTLENISKQIYSIEKNNFSSMDNITSIEMLLTSNNNGTPKDRDISQKFNDLKSKMQEAVEVTNEIKSMLGRI